jgi:hypothetical protein
MYVTTPVRAPSQWRNPARFSKAVESARMTTPSTRLSDCGCAANSVRRGRGNDSTHWSPRRPTVRMRGARGSQYVGQWLGYCSLSRPAVHLGATDRENGFFTDPHSCLRIRAILRSSLHTHCPSRKPTQCQTATANMRRYRRWLEIGNDLPKIWMYLRSSATAH